MRVTIISKGGFASFNNFEIENERDLINLLNGNKISQYQLSHITIHNKVPGFDLEYVSEEIADKKVRQIFMKECMRRA